MCPAVCAVKITSVVSAVTKTQCRLFGSAPFAFWEYGLMSCNALHVVPQCLSAYTSMFLMGAAAQHNSTFVVNWSRAPHYWRKKFKVSFSVKTPPNWVTSCLKMFQSRSAFHFSQRQLTITPGGNIAEAKHLSCCCTACSTLWKRADGRKFWWA